MARLLLVDDDAIGLGLRRQILERAGHLVSSATQADQARSLFSDLQPEIIILDLRLPEAAAGLALIREFRKEAPAARIIVLSGWTPDLDGRPEAAMVDEILAKPVRSARLLRVVAES
jgi:two-component system phosphate regulon response regulator OmpR